MFVLDNLFNFFIIYQFKGGLAETGQEACYNVISSKNSPLGYSGSWMGTAAVSMERWQSSGGFHLHASYLSSRLT